MSLETIVSFSALPPTRIMAAITCPPLTRCNVAAWFLIAFVGDQGEKTVDILIDASIFNSMWTLPASTLRKSPIRIRTPLTRTSLPMAASCVGPKCRGFLAKISCVAD